MKRLTDTQMYDKLTNADCYIQTVNAADKNKVLKARSGINPTTPASLIGQVAAELGLRAHAQETPPPPPPPPPPPDPKTIYFPRTFNKEGTSDARFCVSRSSPAYSHEETPERIFDKGGGVYNTNGLCDGGRDPDFIAKRENGVPLRGAKSMDNFGPCDLYDGLTEWPPDSYHR